MKLTRSAIVLAFLSAVFFLHAQTIEYQMYSSQYAVWNVWDTSFYRQYKTQVDSIIHVLDRGIPGIIKRLGETPKLPIKVHIEQGTGGGLGGWAGGGEVGYTSTCFTSAGGMAWIKGVVIGECVNVATGSVTGDWPVDWWVDGVWYFPGFVVVDVLKEAADTASAKKWETDEKYPTYPVYNLFNSLLKEFGWVFYQNFFDKIKADTMSWGKIGANPSKIKTDYVIAYMSLAAGRNLGTAFKNANVPAADSAEIAAIMSVEARLRLATTQKLNVASAWTSFRNGNYAAAKQVLDNLGVSAIRHNGFVKNDGISGRAPLSVVVYSINGQRVYSAPGDKFDAAVLKRICNGRTVIVKYGYGDGTAIDKKLIVK
jgi:hypothetical protein